MKTLKTIGLVGLAVIGGLLLAVLMLGMIVLDHTHFVYLIQ